MSGQSRGWKRLGEDRGRRPCAVAFDEPSGRASVPELDQRLTGLRRGVAGPDPEQVLLEGAEKTPGAAVASGARMEEGRCQRLFQPRPRRACLGELVQIDGSEHSWFEDRGPKCTLLVFIDDATDRLVQEFRLQSVCSPEAGNAALPALVEPSGPPVMAACTTRVAKAAGDARNMHRPVAEADDLAPAFGWQEAHGVGQPDAAL